MCFEDQHYFTGILQKYGYDVERHNHSAILSGLTEHVTRAILDRKGEVIYADFYLAFKTLPSKRNNAYWHRLMWWARFCKRSAVTFVLFGTYGPKWKQAEIESAVSEKILQVTEHRLCHWNMKLDENSENPSGSTYKMATTLTVPPHECCGKPWSSHDKDYEKSNTARPARRREQVKSELAEIILKPWLSSSAKAQFLVSPPPDSPVQLKNDSHAQPANHENAFPTDERVRQKQRQQERKAAGIEFKRRIQHVEEHYDDCGQDLSGLGKEVAEDAADYLVDNQTARNSQFVLHAEITEETHDASDLREHYEEASQLALHFLKGSAATNDDWSEQRPTLRTVSCIEEFLHVLTQRDYNDGERDDVVEICGGSTRISIICARRRLTVGEDFDLLTGYYPDSPKDQKGIWHYLELRKQIVVVMSPTCTQSAGTRVDGMWFPVPEPSSASWEEPHDAATPHGRLCGEVALHQCKARESRQDHSCFINEQPNPSNLYKEPPWPLVLSRSDVAMQTFHQCATGQVGPNNLPAKKPSGLVSNEQRLLQSVEKFCCDGTHQHDDRSTSHLLRHILLAKDQANCDCGPGHWPQPLPLLW